MFAIVKLMFKLKVIDEISTTIYEFDNEHPTL